MESLKVQDIEKKYKSKIFNWLSCQLKDKSHIVSAIDNMDRLSQLNESDVFYHLLDSLYPITVKTLIQPFELIDPEKKTTSRILDYAKILQMKFQELFKTEVEGLNLQQIKEMLAKDDNAFFRSEDFTRLLILFIQLVIMLILFDPSLESSKQILMQFQVQNRTFESFYSTNQFFLKIDNISHQQKIMASARSSFAQSQSMIESVQSNSFLPSHQNGRLASISNISQITHQPQSAYHHQQNPSIPSNPSQSHMQSNINNMSRHEYESNGGGGMDYEQYSNGGDHTGSGVNNSGIIPSYTHNHRRSYQLSQNSLKQQKSYDNDKQSIGSETELHFGQSPPKKKNTFHQPYNSTSSREPKYQTRIRQFQQLDHGQSSSFHNSHNSMGYNSKMSGDTNFQPMDASREIEFLRGENNFLQEKLQHLEQEMMDMTETIKMDKDEMNAELDELDSELEAKRIENDELIARVRELESECDRLQKGIEDYAQVFKTKEQREMLLINKLKELRTTRDKFYTKTRQISIRSSQMTKEYELLRKSISDMAMLCQEQLKLQVQELTLSLKQQHEKEATLHRRQLREANQQADELKSHYETKINRLQDMVTLYQSQNSNKSDQEKKEIQSLEDMLKRQQEQNDSLQAKIDHQKHQHTKQLEEKIDELKKLHQEETLAKLKDQKEKLSFSLKQKLDEQRTKLESELKDSQIKNKQQEIEAMNANHQAKIKELETAIEDKEKEISHLKEKIADMESDMQLRITIKQDRDKAEKEHAQQHQPRASAQANAHAQPRKSQIPTEQELKVIEQLNKDIEALKKDLKDKDAILEQLQTDFDDFQAQSSKRLQQRKKEIDVLKEDNEKLREELEKCLKMFQQQQLKNLKQRDSLHAPPMVGYGLAQQRSKSQLNLTGAIQNIGNSQQKGVHEYDSQTSSGGMLNTLNKNDSNNSGSPLTTDQLRIRYNQDSVNNSGGDPLRSGGGLVSNFNHIPRGAASGASGAISAIGGNMTNLPLPQFPRNGQSVPRTPNQLQSSTFQRQGPFQDDKSASNDGVVSSKSLFQALSQQLQIDQKLNFSTFEREETKMGHGFGFRKSGGGIGQRANSLADAQGRHLPRETDPYNLDEDDDDGEDEDQNLSFFLSNESSKHRDSRITGDESFQRNLNYGMNDDSNASELSQSNSMVRRDSSIKSSSNRSSLVRNNVSDYQ